VTPVDSFRYLPRLIATYYRMTEMEPELPIPWTPLARPLADCTLGLVTSGGLYHRPIDSPFDLERERAEPAWGDPSYRVIPTSVQAGELGASHLHINTEPVLADVNVLLPLDRGRELAAEGRIGRLASHAFSFMGYQGFPPDTTPWRTRYGPEVATRLKNEGVDCVLLVPA
jgi:D-proline reductase (dithiol) PrdB